MRNTIVITHRDLTVATMHPAAIYVERAIEEVEAEGRRRDRQV